MSGPAIRRTLGARESTVSAELLIDLLRYLNALQLETAELAKLLDTHTKPSQPNARIPGAVAEHFWEQAVRLTGDADFGLHCAENFNPGALNILGYVLLSCRTAQEALGRLARYAALLNDGMRIRVDIEGDRTVCRYEALAHLDNYLVRSPRQAMESMACGTRITLRRLTTTNVQPLAVAFRHPRPASSAEHEQIFGLAVQFDQPENRVDFRSAELKLNLLSANPMLLEVFDAQARQLLDHLGQHGPCSHRVLAILARRIVANVPSLVEIAGELAMSERSLQRELRAENTSYRQLIEDLRKEIACQHLARPGATASEAAFLLGFSEPSAFTRAFRRWTGAPPTQFQIA